MLGCAEALFARGLRMLNRCRNCDAILREGDRITVTVTARYHALKSKVAFAIGRDIEDANADTLQHAQCLQGIA